MAWIVGTSGNNNLFGTADNDFMWGLEGNDFLTADAGDDFLDGGLGADYMRGGIGNDRYVVDNVGDVVEEAGNGFDIVQSSISWTMSAGIERLILTGSANLNGFGNGSANEIEGNSGSNQLYGGGGNDTLRGNGGDDYLYGESGNDVLIGGVGADVMAGGTGNDTYYVDNASDLTFEWGGQGTDIVYSSINLTLAAAVENLTLTGSALTGIGNEGDNVLTGNGYDNALKGAGGADTLDGSWGADTMLGGTGDDTYYVDNVGDITAEVAGEGNDRVMSAMTWTLGDNVEMLFLTGSAFINGTGNSLGNQIRGNTGDNVLAGLDGNDQLYGGLGADTLIGGNEIDFLYGEDGADILNGEAGNDSLVGGMGDDLLIGEDGNDLLQGQDGANTLVGGLGDDSYLIWHGGDTIIEAAGEGRDFVQAYVNNYTLGANLEELQLGWDPSITSGNGNALDNTLYGNNFDNVLSGGDGNDLLEGRAGADTMIGGNGFDYYYLDNPGDVVVELADGGYDSLRVSFSYTLGANLEGLQLEWFSGAVNAIGNALDNQLGGNELNNFLWGGEGNDNLDGGEGADTMDGGNGNDGYVVDNAGDVVIDTGGSNDWVSSFIDYTLDPFQIENLLLMGTATVGIGNGLDNLFYGNNLDNTLVTGTGTDTLYGFGGLNTLAGGGDNDTYYVDVATDLIIEYANEGLDTVIARHDYVLPETSVENITAWEYGGYMIITGNSLNNVIIGNNGFNVIDGRGGADTLYGGAFADQFVFSDVSHSAAGARDEIMDFSSADHDYIDLSLIDANTTLMGDQAFTFHGSAAFSGVAGQLRVAGVFVEGDVNGDAVADFVLAVFGSTPVETDFVL